jgi:hypothetical protein
MFRDVTNQDAVISSTELFAALYLTLKSGEALTEKVEGPMPQGAAVNGQMPIADFAVYTADRKDPEALKLDVIMRCEGKVYKSHVHAVRLWPGAFEIHALTLNNAIQKLDSAYDIRQSLESIGSHCIRPIHCETMPDAPRQKKDLSDLASEFISRVFAKIYTPKPNCRPSLNYVTKSNLIIGP